MAWRGKSGKAPEEGTGSHRRSKTHEGKSKRKGISGRWSKELTTAGICLKQNVDGRPQEVTHFERPMHLSLSQGQEFSSSGRGGTSH